MTRSLNAQLRKLRTITVQLKFFQFLEALVIVLFFFSLVAATAAFSEGTPSNTAKVFSMSLAVTLSLLFAAHRFYYKRIKDRYLGLWRSRILRESGSLYPSDMQQTDFRRLVQLYPTHGGPPFFSGTLGLPIFRALLIVALLVSFILLWSHSEF